MKNNQKLKDTINNVFSKYLKGRLDVLDKNYSVHSKKLEESFYLIDDMKILMSKLVDSDGCLLKNTLNNTDLSKSFCSTASSKTFIANKSRLTRQNSRPKTPFKADKSVDKKILVAKKSTVNMNKGKTLISNKSSSMLASNKSVDRGVSANKLKKSYSKTKLIENVSTSENVSPTNFKRSIRNSKLQVQGPSTPDLIRSKSQLKLNKMPPNSNNGDIVKTEGNYFTRSKSKKAILPFKDVVKSVKEFKSVKSQGPRRFTQQNNIIYDKQHQFLDNAFEKDINVSRILTAEQGLPDDSLINNKDDLYDIQDGELDLLTKQLNWNISKSINTPTESNNYVVMNNHDSNKENTSPTLGNKFIELDFQEIIEDRFALFFKFFDTPDQLKLLLVNKTLGHDALVKIVSNLESEKKMYEEKLNQAQTANKLNLSSSSFDSNNTQDKFAFGKGTNKATELLNDNLYNKLFSDTSLPNEDILIVYKLYFQIIKHPLTKLFNNKLAFWSETCKYFLKESQGKTGNLLSKSLRIIDNSDENIYQIIKILGNNSSKINPNYFSKICGTTGLIVFFIKDVLDYLGISADKKSLPSKSLKSYSSVVRVLESKIRRLKNLLDKCYNISI